MCMPSDKSGKAGDESKASYPEGISRTWGRQRDSPAPNPAVQFNVDNMGLLRRTSALVMENCEATESHVLFAPDVVTFLPEM